MMRILLVDDELTAVSGLQKLLELDGYYVAATDSSTAALELLAAQPFDAVVTDLEMPIVNGVALARAARVARAGITVLVVTGYAGSPAAADALAAGARRILGKPLDYEVLIDELHAALGE